jgi:hypothetical protein
VGRIRLVPYCCWGGSHALMVACRQEAQGPAAVAAVAAVAALQLAPSDPAASTQPLGSAPVCSGAMLPLITLHQLLSHPPTHPLGRRLPADRPRPCGDDGKVLCAAGQAPTRRHSSSGGSQLRHSCWLCQISHTAGSVALSRGKAARHAVCGPVPMCVCGRIGDTIAAALDVRLAVALDTLHMRSGHAPRRMRIKYVQPLNPLRFIQLGGGGHVAWSAARQDVAVGVLHLLPHF